MSTAALSASPAGPPLLDPAREVRLVLAGMSAVRHAYQPIVQLAGGVVRGYEALARFGSGQRSPQAFFDAAESIGKRAELEVHLLELGLLAVDAMPADCYLAINVSPVLLTSDAIWSLLRQAGPLDRVVLELTEHAPVDNLVALRRRVDILREQGARLALDDVGAGWSGLAQMAALRPDIVKLDKCLVRGLADDDVKLALAELMAGFAAKIGSQLLAEGVEQPEELLALSELGVDLAQGWLLGRPQFRPAGLALAAGDALGVVQHALPPATATMRHVQDSDVLQVRHPAAVGFLSGGLPEHAIVIDEAGTPTGLWVCNPNPGLPSGWQHDVTCVPAAMTLPTALVLALGRPDVTRNDALVVLTSSGRASGVVRVQTLLDELVLGTGPMVAGWTTPG